MLEESAAQLAALRQRAELILEQMSTGPGTSLSSESSDGAAKISARPEGDQPRSDPGQERNDRSEPDRLILAEPEQNRSVASNSSAASSDKVDHGDGVQEWSLRSQSSPQDDIAPISDTAPNSDSARNADTAHISESLSQPPQAIDQHVEEELHFTHAGAGPPPQQQFPIQNYQPQYDQPQSDSVLDTPVTAAPPPDWFKFEVAPESLSADAQLIEEEILILYEAIDRFRETRRENTGHALSLLREAREIISSQPNRVERAEYNIQQARLIIERARTSRRRSRGIALRTFSLLLLWLAGLGGLGAALYLQPLEVNEIIGTVGASTGWNTSHYYSLLWTVAAGGIGGWLGTISFLFERMRVHEEFDRLYILRSLIQPLMGVVLGVIAYGLLAALFNSLNVSITTHAATTYLPAAFAFPIGIWQVYVYAAIFRITTLLTFQRRRRW